MYKINKFKIVLFFSLTCSLCACSQNQKKEKHEIVKQFFEDLFTNDVSLEQISKEYRYQGLKIKSKDEAKEMFEKYIRALRVENPHLYKKGVDFKVENYNNSSIKDLWAFEKKERKNIVIVSVDNKIVRYVLLKKNKIISFVYFRKGSEGLAFFIPYYAKQEF